jgi:hypothetical protein
MLVTLWHDGRRRVSAELPASVKWCSTAAREFGSASFTIPYTHRIYSRQYFMEDGGQLVWLYKRGVGLWRGVTLTVSEDENGAVVQAIALEAITAERHVSTNQAFIYCTADMIVREAVRDATSGLARSFIGEGSFCGGGPFIPLYEFTGQTLAQVLADMMELTGMEWQIDEWGALSWTPPMGRLQQRHLCEGGDVVGASRNSSAAQRAAQVTVRGTGVFHTEDANEVIGKTWWPHERQIDLQTTSLGALQETAKIVIDQVRWPAVEYQMTLKAHVNEDIV